MFDVADLFAGSVAPILRAHSFVHLRFVCRWRGYYDDDDDVNDDDDDDVNDGDDDGDDDDADFYDDDDDNRYRPIMAKVRSGAVMLVDSTPGAEESFVDFSKPLNPKTKAPTEEDEPAPPAPFIWRPDQ